MSEIESQRQQASHRDRKQLSTESNFLQMDHCRLTKSLQCCPCTVQILASKHSQKNDEGATKDDRFHEWGYKFNFIFPYREIWQLLSFHHFQAIHMVLHNLMIWGFSSVWACALQYRGPLAVWGSHTGGAFSEEQPFLTRKIALWFLFRAGEEYTNVTRRQFGLDLINS